MLFYLSIICIASLFAGIADTQKKRNKIGFNILYVISAIVLFLPLAMRGMGVDYSDYTQSYKYTSVSWEHFWKNYIGRPEPLYAVINYCARWIFNSFQGVNIICAFISILFTYLGIYKFKNKVDLGITIWCVGFLFYILMYGLNRMMIAVSLITWSYHYYIEKNIKKYILITFIAGMVHWSALLMIPFYFIMRRMENKRTILHMFNWTKALVGVSFILVVIYRIVPFIFGHFSWFARYKYLFELTFNLATLNNNAGTYVCVMLMLIYKNKIERFLDKDAGLITMINMLVIIAVTSIIMPVHRLCYFFFPACALMYGVIPNVLRNEAMMGNRMGSDRVASIVYKILLIIMGGLLLYRITEIETLWAPYINPYIFGKI